MATASFDGNNWQAELDVGSLSEGLHVVFFQLTDTSLVWNPTKCYTFFKAEANESMSMTYHCWFDQDAKSEQTGILGSDIVLLDVESLSEGLHTVSIALEGSAMNPSKTYTFMKVVGQNPSLDVSYHCWFDQDATNQQTGILGSDIVLLDVESLSEGLHTVTIALEGSAMNPSKTYTFMKVVGQNPSLDVSYHCWFDQDAKSEQTGILGSDIVLLDVESLSEGLHTVTIALEGGVMNPSKTYTFMKVVGLNPSLDVVYHCWFDQDVTNQQTGTLGSDIVLLDVENLSEGIHTVTIALEGSAMNPSKTYIFMKLTQQNPTMDVVYHYWFDQDATNQQTGTLGSDIVLLDVENLSEGLHTVTIALEGNAMNPSRTYLFMKVPEPTPPAEVHYRCWFDQNTDAIQSGIVGNGLFELEVGHLTNGVHTLYVQLDNGSINTPRSYLFYKRPVGGVIAKWEYWLNDAINNRHATVVSPPVDTLEIISLLQMETWPIRSSCFHFHPNGDEPYINAKNEVTFRFYDVDYHTIDKSAFYIDEQVEQSIEATVFERNSTETIPAPTNNQIRWFKLEVGRGDYLSFVADKVCTMQLFAPSGEEVYSVSGVESLQIEGFNVWEDGFYYLAVHDATGNSETVSITYNWLNRYAVVSYDVHLVGNGGCSTITFQGNGFNSLVNAYLVNYQNDTIRSLDIGHESNTTTTVSLNFYQENLGVYDAVFEFFEETIRINGALEVQEPVDILLTSSVSYPSQFLRNTPCTYTYTITNNGNMSAYAVPLFVSIATPTLDGVSHLEFDGLDLPSFMDYFDKDSLTSSELEELALFSLEEGEDHCFFMFPIIDENTGDSVFIRCNYFFMNLAPFETKTVTLKITSDASIEAWVTIPNDTILPLTMVSNRGAILGHYCCAQNFISCNLDVICSALDLIELVVSVIPGLPYKVVASVASCICDVISLMNTQLSLLLCENDAPSGFWDMMKRMNYSSMIGAAASCFTKKLLKGFSLKLFEILNLIQRLKTLLLSGVTVSNDCSTQSLSGSNCPPGDPQGGGSTPVKSLDPNDIHGYLSESGSHYMRQEIQNVQYEIEFENDTTLATAAAHTIIVRDTLDATKFDLNSLAARSVTIGDKRLELNGEQIFAHTLDLRPEIYVIAQMEQDYDPATGIIQWTIQSLDPMTMEPTDDPNQGVLPVNYYGNGVGFIDYSIDIKDAFADGTTISNRAGIIFDQNDVIMTPTWTNIIDAVKPVSHIEEVVLNADTLNFIFASEDNRSGVWYHTLYHRNASTEMEWKVKKAQIFENNYLLVNDELMTTEFLVMATDSAGNREEKEMLAEYIFVYDGPGQITQADALAQGWNWWSTYIEQNDQDGLVELESSLGHNGLTIKSQNDFTDNFYQDMGVDYWYGSLESIQNEQGYLINVAQQCNTSITGVAANAANHPITIHPNWNWIGYPVASPQAVTSALAGFTPSPDDVVKGQSDFTSYFEGYGWYPEDFMLIPGQSYLYCSNANANKTLNYTGGSRGGAVKMTKAEKRYWNNNVHAFADNFNVIAVVKVDNVEQRGENLELGAFVDGECRGSARLRYFAPLDRYYAMLTITGQEDDKVEFRLIDSENLDREEIGLNQLVFKKNAVVGRLGKPYEICFGDNDVVTVNMAMYPNPVKKGHEFSLDIPYDEIITEITITDALGNQLRHESGAVNVKSVNGLPTAGVYVIKAVTKSGTIYHGRLIVE